jgi:hypothetical protein
MKYLLLVVFIFSIVGCDSMDKKREVAADAAFDAAYNHCIYSLKKDPGECEAYMESNWQRFYTEPK